MKKLAFFTLFFAFCTVVTIAQTQTAPSNSKSPHISFAETSKSFGDIKQGETVSHTFTFKNTGKEPLIISSVQTTCGCTVANYTKDPILPGKTGEIKASFNSTGKFGGQNKVITVLSNADNNPERVSIICNVVVPSSSESTGK